MCIRDRYLVVSEFRQGTSAWYPLIVTRSGRSKEAFPLGPTEVSAALVVLGSLRRRVATLFFVSQGSKSFTPKILNPGARPQEASMRRFSTTLAIAISTLLFVSICSAQQAATTS